MSKKKADKVVPAAEKVKEEESERLRVMAKQAAEAATVADNESKGSGSSSPWTRRWRTAAPR